MAKNKDQFEHYNLSSVKAVLCGSAPINREQITEFVTEYSDVKYFIQGMLKFTQIQDWITTDQLKQQPLGYGMTEIVCLSHITPLIDSIIDDPYLGSCGKLIPGFEAKVLKEIIILY